MSNDPNSNNNPPVLKFIHLGTQKRTEKVEKVENFDSDHPLLLSPSSDVSSSSSSSSSTDTPISLPETTTDSESSSSNPSTPRSFATLVVYGTKNIFPQISIESNHCDKRYIQFTPNTFESSESIGKNINVEQNSKHSKSDISFFKAFNFTGFSQMTDMPSSLVNNPTSSVLDIITDSKSHQSVKNTYYSSLEQLPEEKVLEIDLYTHDIQMNRYPIFEYTFMENIIPLVMNSTLSQLAEILLYQLESKSLETFEPSPKTVKISRKIKRKYKLYIPKSNQLYKIKSKNNLSFYPSYNLQKILKTNNSMLEQKSYHKQTNSTIICTYGYIYQDRRYVDIVYKILLFQISIELIREIYIPYSLLRLVQNRSVRTQKKKSTLKLCYFDQSFEIRNVSSINLTKNLHAILNKKYRYLIKRSASRIFRVIIDDYQPCFI